MSKVEIAKLLKLQHIFLGRAARARRNYNPSKLQQSCKFVNVEIVTRLKLSHFAEFEKSKLQTC